MEFKPSKIKRAAAGYTAVEMLVGVSVGMMVLAAVTTFFMFSLRSFGSMANYSDLNKRDRYASDLITRDVRNALQILSATSSQIVLKAPPVVGSNTVTYTYDSSAKTLTRVDSTTTTILLSGVSSCSFSLYSRPATNSAYDVFPSGTTNNAKLIGYQWTCTRKLVGSLSESESVQVAKVSIRNQ